MATYYPEAPMTPTYTDGSYYQSWPGDSRGATSEVEAFIWRCRQHHDRNSRYKSCGNREMDSATVTTFLNMLTDVHTRCRAMEDQLTDLQKHTQRVTSQLDSMVTHQGKQASSSSSATSVSSSTANTMKAIRKLQWKIFDLQRENEALRALLEMHKTKDQTETATEGDHDQGDTEPPPQSAQASEWTRSRTASKSPQKAPPAQTTVKLSAPQNDNPSQDAQEKYLSDSRVVILMNPDDGLTCIGKHQQASTASQQNDIGCQQERKDYQQQTSGYPQESGRYQQRSTCSWNHPEDSVSSKTTSKDDQQCQEDNSGFTDRFSQPLERQEADQSSGCSKELKMESAKGSTPARYPHTRWTSSDRNRPRVGVPPARQAWRWTSAHPRLFPRVSTKPSTQTGISPGPEPRYQSTPKNFSVDDSRDASPHFSHTGEDVAISCTSDDPCIWSDPCEEAFQYCDRYPCTGELSDLKLKEFNLFATPEDIQLVQGTLELLNSINKLEYTKDSSE
ncbi:uncharacterized protein LOC119734240 [Patiria miniata]|uniref:Uncharacterized protein n=1 Tax=Patiria miniata TaxID=46514 RepID=A0A914AIR7_PATMI|nr:uncharacterized protein LOC119734240 [Patiria miniata]